MTASRSTFLALWCALPALTLGACGYALVDESSVFGPDTRRIRLEMFDNPTNEPGLERMLAEAIYEEFLRGGTLEPTWNGSGAPLQMSGVIRSVEVRASAFDSVGLSLENQVELVVDVDVVRLPEGESVWSTEGIREIERFSASADPNVHETAKQRALLRLSSIVATRIRDELFQTY
ncbi:MAG: hypothetical protein JRG76_06920 [Deltaproteobacteria bacterium]|jgi:hypothetical protein|nr:hypothetical protein [Deltaproteobacteria bacterium]MBW2414226.1 hypothetical protein [Deltaproteobacteria bacterium]